MKNPVDIISDFFHEKNILFSPLPFNLCHIINPKKLDRCIVKKPETVFMLAVPYLTEAPIFSNLSVYARARDYHIYFAELFKETYEHFKSYFPGFVFEGFADNSFIDERHSAVISGLGVYGDNGLVITKEYGSYVFLGEIITDIPFSYFKDYQTSGFAFSFCNHCGKCSSVCPVKKGECQCCLSAVTQKKSLVSQSEEELIKKHNTAWGCDLCQFVCPMNCNISFSKIDFFKNNRLEKLEYSTINKMSDEEFALRAFAWRGKKTILRNLDLLRGDKDNEQS